MPSNCWIVRFAMLQAKWSGVFFQPEDNSQHYNPKKKCPMINTAATHDTL